MTGILDELPGPLAARVAWLLDREYLNGLKAGWNLGVYEDNERFLAIQTARISPIADYMAAFNPQEPSQ